MGFGWLFPLRFMGIIIYILQNKTNGKESKSSAQEILDKRYASGDINKKEYEEKSKDLSEQKIKE